MFNRETLALVDADSIYFRAAMSSPGDKENIRRVISNKMVEIDDHLLYPTFKVAVKGEGNFRKNVYPEYKKNRKELDSRLKADLKYGLEFMVGEYGAIKADGMEADDLVSIWAHSAMKERVEYVVVGIDKDLLQIPGRHLNFRYMTDTRVSSREAQYNLALQCLTGDRSDNIPGLKGIGPKKAEKLLDGAVDVWRVVNTEWRNRGLDPTVTRRLLTMLKEHP